MVSSDMPSGRRVSLSGNAVIAVVVLSESPIVCSALAGLFRSQQNFRVLGEVADLAQCTARVRPANVPTVVVIDLRSHGSLDVDSLKALRSMLPATPLVVFNDGDIAWQVRETLRIGVRGYVHATATPRELFQAVRVVQQGKVYLDSAAQSALSSGLAANGSGRGSHQPLNERERAILALVADGRTNAEIGAAICLSESTVKYHLNRVFQKLEVSNRVEAARLAVELHLLSPRAKP